MDLRLPTTYYNMSNQSVRQCEMDKDVKNYNQNQESKCFHLPDQAKKSENRNKLRKPSMNSY